MKSTDSPESFKFPVTGAKVRVVMRRGEPWFVAKDVLDALGLRGSPGVHYGRLGRSEKSYVSRTDLGLRPGKDYVIISESGLYRLIMRSDKPQAKAFQDWVTGTVLPAIRKDGMYVVGEEKVATGELAETELVLKALTLLQGKVERLSTEKAGLQATIEEHLKLLTADEWRALNHLYMLHPDKVRLSARARKMCKAEGVEVAKQDRTLPLSDGSTRAVQVNVYPQAILDRAAAELGFAVTMHV